MAELRGEHTAETEEYGIGSLVYRADRPFNPLRLCALLASSALTSELLEAQAKPSVSAELTDTEISGPMQVVAVPILRALPEALQFAIAGKYGRIIRSKGLAWVAGAEPGPGEAAVAWSHSARVVELVPSMPWAIARADHELQRAQLSKAAGSTAAVVPPFQRFTELVLIGFGIVPDRLRAALDACLLSPEDTAAGPELWGTLPNPLFGTPESVSVPTARTPPSTAE
jgi:G3E family GTPase